MWTWRRVTMTCSHNLKIILSLFVWCYGLYINFWIQHKSESYKESYSGATSKNINIQCESIFILLSKLLQWIMKYIRGQLKLFLNICIFIS
jgi:F0F1-type ATP synthase membrane subunit a